MQSNSHLVTSFSTFSKKLSDDKNMMVQKPFPFLPHRIVEKSTACLFSSDTFFRNPPPPPMRRAGGLGEGAEGALLLEGLPEVMEAAVREVPEGPHVAPRGPKGEREVGATEGSGSGLW